MPFRRRRFGNAGSAMPIRRRDVSAMVVENVLYEKTVFEICFFMSIWWPEIPAQEIITLSNVR